MEDLNRTNHLREQLRAEFSTALESGGLQKFVRSLDEALKKPVNRHDVESELSEFLIKGWINPAAPFCCFDYAALADLLAGVLNVKDLNVEAVAKQCRRLKLKPVPNPPVSVVMQQNKGVFKLGIDARQIRV